MNDNSNSELLKRILSLEIENSRLKDLNKELKDSNTLHSAIIESNPDIDLFVLDSDYRYIKFNDKHKNTIMKLWGKEVCIGMNPLDIIDRDDDREKFKDNLKEALLGNYFNKVEQYGDKRYSRLFWGSSWSPLYNEGEIIGLICLSQDVTKLVNAEKELENEMKFTKAVLDSSPGMLYIYDEEGALVKWNKKHEEMTGFNYEELSEKKLEFWFEKEDFYRVSKEIDDVFFKGSGEVEAEIFVNEGKSIDILTNNVKLEMDGKYYLLGAGIDISNRKKLEEDLMKERNFLSTILASVGEGVISCGISGEVTFLNRVAEILTGWKLEEAKGQPIENVFHIIDEFTRRQGENIVQKVIESKRIIDLQNHTLLISKDGIERVVEDTAAPIMDRHGNILGVVLVFKDCTMKKQNLGQIKYLKHRDQLTGLYNRRYFEEELKRLDIEENLPLSIVMGDVNGLKLVNDSFGHHIGDKLLKKTADILKESCKDSDIIARLGGDEFIILLANTERSQAEKLVNEIRKMSTRDKVETLDLSISFGYETKTDINEDILDVLKRTEDYMYRSKLSESWSMRNGTIEMLMNSLYEKSNREMLHSKRVSKISGLIAKKLGLKEETIKDLSMAGLMHDIGKMGISDSILDKDGKLTDCQWKEVKKHPEIGYRILSSVNEFSEIAKYILEHHERWDGYGYPRGLKGEEISIYGRIIAVADSYDAMTNDRTYRVGLSKEEALVEISQCAGKQFDPKVAKVFIEEVACLID